MSNMIFRNVLLIEVLVSDWCGMLIEIHIPLKTKQNTFCINKPTDSPRPADQKQQQIPSPNLEHTQAVLLPAL